MASDVDLYDTHYAHLAAIAQTDVRRETYDEGSRAIEAGSRWPRPASGFACCDLTRTAACSRSDADPAASHAAWQRRLARQPSAWISTRMALRPPPPLRCARSLSSRVSFQVVDAAQRLPFADASFDAIFSNDAINHLPRRAELFRRLAPCPEAGWTPPLHRSHRHHRAGYERRDPYSKFDRLLSVPLPRGATNVCSSGRASSLQEVHDVTDAEASVSARWRDARARRRDALAAIEGRKALRASNGFSTRSARFHAKGVCRGSPIWRANAHSARFSSNDDTPRTGNGPNRRDRGACSRRDVRGHRVARVERVDRCRLLVG